MSFNFTVKAYTATRGTVCIGSEGDHGYAPSMKLADLVLRIIEMVRYENIGFTSPFNLEAKRWAQKNMHLFPLDDGQIVTESALDIVILEESLGDGSGDHVGDPETTLDFPEWLNLRD